MLLLHVFTTTVYYYYLVMLKASNLLLVSYIIAYHSITVRNAEFVIYFIELILPVTMLRLGNLSL